MNNYSFDRQGFLTYMKKLPSSSKVIWRYLAIKFHVKNKSGQFPENAGQVLMTFATQNGIDTDQFNECKRVSGRDFLLRIRRSRQKIYRNRSIPTPRPARKLMEEVHSKLQNRELYIGEKIAPKMFKTNRIDKSGTLTELDYTVYGRMIPLTKIIQHMREMHKDYQRETETNELIQDISRFGMTIRTY